MCLSCSTSFFFFLIGIRISTLSSTLKVSNFICYLQNLLPFLGPLLRKSSEAHRNLSVIKSLRQSENLQVCIYHAWDFM
jgi:hypothetical protein